VLLTPLPISDLGRRISGDEHSFSMSPGDDTMLNSLPVTDHVDITPPRSESPVQWQGRIKPAESHIADLKAKFQDWQT